MRAFTLVLSSVLANELRRSNAKPHYYENLQPEIEINEYASSKNYSSSLLLEYSWQPYSLENFFHSEAAFCIHVCRKY